MMKRILPFFLLVAFCASVSLADYSDGFITTGEYEYGVRWTSNDPPLIVNGGGADVIEVRNFGRLEVRSTSIPVGGNWHTGGITDIWVTGNGHLDYFGGITEELTTHVNATASLYGGSIVGITSMQYPTTPYIDLYCQPGWSWRYTGSDITGITGLWNDGTAFDIMLINDEDYFPTWMNINVIPEPATLALFGLGGLLLRRKR